MREDGPVKARQRRKDFSAWREKELLDGKISEAGVIILTTSGCSHWREGACSMCGYNIGSRAGITSEQLIGQFDSAAAELGDVEMLKVYTSGSFLDEREVPGDAAKHMLDHCRDRGVRLLLESRPEYIVSGPLDRVLGTHDDLEVAIGLESSNDRVLRYSVNKGFSVKDYDEAAAVLRGKGVGLRTYVLLKPPYLTEAEAVDDAKATIAHAGKVSRTVSLNPVNVQKGTVVEKLWRNWAYRPPWLWSVVEVLRGADSGSARLVCDPTGGGKERGAHNCGKCDETILAGIRAFSLSQEKHRMGTPDCGCRDLWGTVMGLEGFIADGTVDLERFFRKH